MRKATYEELEALYYRSRQRELELRDAVNGLAFAISPSVNGKTPDWDGDIEPHFREPMAYAKRALNSLNRRDGE